MKMKSLGGNGESMSEQSSVKFSKWIKYFSVAVGILGNSRSLICGCCDGSIQLMSHLFMPLFSGFFYH